MVWQCEHLTGEDLSAWGARMLRFGEWYNGFWPVFSDGFASGDQRRLA